MNLVERIKGILLTPQTEWAVIEREPGDAPYLFINYVAILAAIPAVAGFIGAALVGYPTAIGTVRVGIGAALIAAIVQYVLAFASVYLVALLVDILAPTFNGQRNFENALKLTVYSYTPVWLAGIFFLIPSLGFLSIVGLYGLYLLWSGTTPMMKAPQEKSLVYTAAIIVCAIIVALIVNVIVRALLPLPRPM